MIRIGQSTDIHRLVLGRPLILGGIEIPHKLGLEGHSDADVLTHAIMEAILGALALGDLGTHFPDTDPAYKGVCSFDLLDQVYKHMIALGYTIGNIDALVLAQAPKLAPYMDVMRASLCKALNIELNQLNLKATTGERLGFIGNEEGIVAQAVVLLFKKG